MSQIKSPYGTCLTASPGFGSAVTTGGCGLTSWSFEGNQIKSPYGTCLTASPGFGSVVTTGGCGLTSWSFEGNRIKSPYGTCLTASPGFGSVVTTGGCGLTSWSLAVTSFNLAQSFDTFDKLENTPHSIEYSNDVSTELTQPNYNVHDDTQNSPTVTAFASILGGITVISLALVGYNHCCSEKSSYEEIV